MIPYTKENWNECLECLGFKEIKKYNVWWG